MGKSGKRQRFQHECNDTCHGVACVVACVVASRQMYSLTFRHRGKKIEVGTDQFFFFTSQLDWWSLHHVSLSHTHAHTHTHTHTRTHAHTNIDLHVHTWKKGGERGKRGNVCVCIYMSNERIHTHTATHCNTLQHTLQRHMPWCTHTHYVYICLTNVYTHTLQHTATHCNTHCNDTCHGVHTHTMYIYV